MKMTLCFNLRGPHDRPEQTDTSIRMLHYLDSSYLWLCIDTKVRVQGSAYLVNLHTT